MKVKIVETQLEVVSAELIAAHPELHHYTNRAGLEGILASETLWATHFEDLNDATEVTHLRAPLTEALAARMIRRLAERRNESMSHRRRIDAAGGVYRTATGLARDLISALYKTTFQDDGGAPLGVPFITSFCSHSDDQCYERKNGLLSQWRGYGGVGGYCLVFDTDKLGAALSCEFGQHHYVHINLVAAQYGLSETSIGGAFPELVDLCEGVIQPLLEGAKGQDLDPRTFPALVAGATGFKHRGFFEEREVRVVAIPASEDARQQTMREFPDAKLGPLKPIWERETSGGRRRHLTLFEDAKIQLPIKRLIVGPSSDQNERYRSVLDLVKGRFPVHLSETPYLG